MSVAVNLQAVQPRTLAAVRRELAPDEIGAAWRPALDQVWAFVRSQPGLWAGGHNVFVYHQPAHAGSRLTCDFGVEVTRTFEPHGEVHPTATPAGEAAVAVYRGAYDRMHEAYAAIEHWLAANGRQPAGQSWEIYGDPTPDPANTETTVMSLLK